jgi:hypothetical protein
VADEAEPGIVGEDLLKDLSRVFVMLPADGFPVMPGIRNFKD